MATDVRISSGMIKAKRMEEHTLQQMDQQVSITGKYLEELDDVDVVDGIP